MDILTRTTDKIVVAHGTITEVSDKDFFLINGKHHIQFKGKYTLTKGLTEPDGFADKKFKYTTEDGIHINADYVEPESIETLKAEIAILKTDKATLETEKAALQAEKSALILENADLKK